MRATAGIRRKQSTQPQSLREHVYQHLRTLMNQGKLRPGAFLDLNALAEEIGISRTPLRDALLRLESEGFVEILNRRGVRIVCLTLDLIRHIYELLGALESAALRNVADRIDAEVIDRMDALDEEMARALQAGDFTRFYDANLAFHNAYLGLSDNHELLHHITILKQRLYDFPRLPDFVADWEWASIEEHRTLVRLLREGRIGDAADLLRDVHWSYRYQERFIRRYYAGSEHAPVAALA